MKSTLLRAGIALLLSVALYPLGCLESDAVREAREHVERGAVALEEDRVSDALSAYDQAIARAPDYLPGHIGRAEALTVAGRFAEARTEFDSILQRDPNSAAAYAGSGRLLALQGRIRDAEQKYARAFELDDDQPPEVIGERAILLSALRRNEEAVVLFERMAADGRPPGPDVLLHWGISLERLERTDEALSKYEAALEQKPDGPSLLNNLGLLLFREEIDRDRGLALMQRAVSGRPGDPALLHNLGWALLEAGRPEESYNLLRRALAATAPSNPVYALREKHLRAAGEKLPRLPAQPEMPNVLLIVVDTLRADHLGAYGYSRPTSPNIDRLAEQGVVFEQAISQAPWTAASMASLMTGLYPSVHGLDSGARWGPGQQSAGGKLPFAVQAALSSSQLTLAEVLRRSGYSTAGFVSNVYVNSIFGFAQGFDVYDDEHRKYSRDIASVKRRGGETTRRVFRWLKGGVQEPFFLFVHYNDPHWPYNPPEPFGAEFVSDYEGELTPAQTTAVVERQGMPVTGLSKSDLAYIVGLYDGEIQYVDHHVGRLLEKVDGAQLERDLLVVFVSDHGEEFLDHGATSHGYTLYEEQIRVPLILRYPGHLSAGRINAQVRLIDVLPTIVSVAGIDSTGLILQGQSLLPLATGASKKGAAFAHSEAAYVGRQKAIRARSGIKLIHDFAGDTTRVFDLSTDPGEKRDLWAPDRESHPGLLQDLQSWVNGNRELAKSAFAEEDASNEVVLDRETQDQLEALGYVQ